MRSRVRKINIPKFVKKFLAFYETGRSIIVFTRARHLPQMKLFHALSHYFLKAHFNITHSFTLMSSK